MRTHERRPVRIICTSCRNDVYADDARECQIAWCLPNKRYADTRRRGGTHTDPQEIFRTGIYMCNPCWKSRSGPMRQPRFVQFLDRIYTSLVLLVEQWVRPPNQPRGMFPEEEMQTRRVA